MTFVTPMLQTNAPSEGLKPSTCSKSISKRGYRNPKSRGSSSVGFCAFSTARCADAVGGVGGRERKNTQVNAHGYERRGRYIKEV